MPDEQGHRLVVEPFADDLPDADFRRLAGRAHLLGLAQVDHFRATRQIRRLVASAVPLPLLRGRWFGGRRFDRQRGRLRFGQFDPVEQGRSFDPLPSTAERHFHGTVDVGLLGLDLRAEVGHPGVLPAILWHSARLCRFDPGDPLADPPTLPQMVPARFAREEQARRSLSRAAVEWATLAVGVTPLPVEDDD